MLVLGNKMISAAWSSQRILGRVSGSARAENSHAQQNHVFRQYTPAPSMGRMGSLILLLSRKSVTALRHASTAP